MIEVGFALSAELYGPRALVDQAVRAEDAGFGFALVSDHYHPWLPQQGQSPFAWSVLGAIGQATERLKVGTGVTCPLMRYHPALVAQWAATMASLIPGRFWLGLGAGENLNEHVFGDAWPPPHLRHDMLREAIEVIRALWQGNEVNHYGASYTVDEARLYTLPEKLPPILVAASGPEAASLAGEAGDGLVSTAPQRELVQQFEAAGGRGKPRLGQATVCWAPDEATARKQALQRWANTAVPSQASWEIKTTDLFAALTGNVTEDQVAGEILCTPDPERHLARMREFAEAGFDHVMIHNVGEDEEGFFRFYEREVLPRARSLSRAA